MGTQTTLVWLSRDGGRMTSHPLTLHEHSLLQRSAACPRRSAFETAAGSLILHSFCPPSLVTSLKADFCEESSRGRNTSSSINCSRASHENSPDLVTICHKRRHHA